MRTVQGDDADAHATAWLFPVVRRLQSYATEYAPGAALLNVIV